MWTLSFMFLAILTFSDSEIHVGGALNIFHFYGDLSVFTKMLSQDDTPGTLDIFDEVTETRSTPNQLENELLKGDFQMEFCDNLVQLMEAFFRDFKIEGSNSPWRAFTGSLSPTTLGKKFGLNVTYVTNQHAYVLVRLLRHWEHVALSDETVTLSNWTHERVQNVKDGDILSVMDFVTKLGSHFVNSYSTGNSMYQIIAYKPEVYQQMKQSLMSQGVSALGLGQPNGYFTPFYADHMGSILTASGNVSLEAWAAENLQSTMYVFIYTSLLKLHTSPTLLRQLNTLLRDEAMLQLELKTLAPIFVEPRQQKWFEEVVQNHLKLWEINV